MAHSHTRPDTIGIRDRVSGAKVGLSLVKSISAIFSHTASRVPWHSHNQFELLFVMDGATVYEFQDRDSIQLAGGHFMVVPPGVMHRGEHDFRMPTTLIGIVLALDVRGATRNTPFTTRDLGWLRRHFKVNSLTVHPLGQALRQTIVQLDRRLSGKKQNDDKLSAADLRIDLCSAISGAARQLGAVDSRDSQFIVDVAIDQGGCIATSQETTHRDPTVTIHGVQHYAVGNMPGAVPFTSTEALVSVTLPYILGIAGRGLEEAVTERPELLSGLNTVQGSVCHPGVAKALGVPPRHPMACLR